MNDKLLAVMAALCAAVTAHAQATASFEWERAFGGTNADFASVVKPTSDGGYAVGGYSYSDPSGDKSGASFGNGDFWIVKLDANGNKQWDASFGGSEFDRVTALQQTRDGGYVIGGTTFSGVSGNKSSGNFGNADFWIVKVDANGAKQWDKTFGGSEADELRALQQTSDNGFVIGGVSSSPVSGSKTSGRFGGNTPDYWIIKLDANGNAQWDRTFGGAEADELNDLQQTSDGGYILAGHSFSSISGNKSAGTFGTNTSDYWFVKLDAGGNKQWDKSYGGNDSEQLFSAQQTSDGGYILGGSSYSGISGNKTCGNNGSHDFWAVKVDGAGNIQWNNAFGGSDADELQSVTQTSDGGYVLGGHSMSTASGSKTSTSSGSESGDYWIVKLDSTGAKQWEQSVRGSFSGEVLRLQSTRENGFVLAGLGAVTSALPDYVVSKVRGPLAFQGYALQKSPFVFRTQLGGITGTDYVLQATTNFVQWTAVQTSRCTNGIVAFSYPIPANRPHCFFRVQQM
jgi:hypothetical protein